MPVEVQPASSRASNAGRGWIFISGQKNSAEGVSEGMTDPAAVAHGASSSVQVKSWAQILEKFLLTGTPGGFAEAGADSEFVQVAETQAAFSMSRPKPESKLE